MPITSAKELYVKMLSDVLKREERMKDIFQSLRETIQEQQIKEFLDSAIFLTDSATTTIERCFKLIGEKPVQTDNKLQDLFMEDFKKELETIQFPLARTLFIASKANHLIQFRLGELESLSLMSEISGHPGVCLLLDSISAQKRVFIDRMLNRIAEVIQEQTE